MEEIVQAADEFLITARALIEFIETHVPTLKFTGRRSGLRAWRGLPDGVGRASTVARDRTRTRRLRARGQRRTGFEDFRIGGHRGVPGPARVSEVLSG